jgi:hypothetical protein
VINLPVARDGLILARDLREVGEEAYIKRALATGEWHRVRRGAFVPTELWKTYNWGRRHRAVVVAAALLAPEPPLLSHLSAAVIWGLPIVGARIDVVHTIVRRTSGGRSTPGMRRHTVLDLPEEMEVDGFRVTTLERTVLDVARTESTITAVSAADRALFAPHRGVAMTTVDGLREQLEPLRRLEGVRAAERVLDFSTTLVRWPGESVSRVQLRRLRFPDPVLQQPFVLLDGSEVAPDFSWPGYRHLGEFDGYIKYQKPEYMNGRTASEVVVEEKRREDGLRALGNGMSRWVWSEVWDLRAFATVLRAAPMQRRR